MEFILVTGKNEHTFKIIYLNKTNILALKLLNIRLIPLKVLSNLYVKFVTGVTIFLKNNKTKKLKVLGFKETYFTILKIFIVLKNIELKL